MSDATEISGSDNVATRLGMERLAERARDAAPTDDLVEVLALHTKAELDAYARELGLTGTSKLRKAELAEQIAAGLATPEGARNLEALLLDCSSLQFDTLRSLADQPLGVTFGTSELLGCTNLDTFEPYVNLFRQGDTFTASVPRQVREALDGMSLDAVAQERRRELNASLFLDACAEFYGLASLDQVRASYEAIADDPLAPNELAALMGHNIQTGLASYDLWDNGDDIYLADYTLSDDYAADEMSSGEEAGKAEIAAELRALDAYRRTLAAAHAQIEARLLDDVWGKDVIEHLHGLPALRALEDFVAEHAPSDEGPARAYARNVVDALHDIRRMSFNYEDYSKRAAKLNVLEDTATPSERTTFRNLAADLYDALPAWELNGWSPAEQRGRVGEQMAPVAFPGSDGGAAKVGRNDPCPCGSGKKYKKCCGK